MHGLNMKNLNHCAPPRSPLYDQVQAENKDYDEVVAEVISKAVAFLMRTMSFNSVDREFRASPV